MLLAIDIGNTSVSFALFDKADDLYNPVVSSKLSYLKNRSSDEYAVIIKSIIDLKLGSDYSIDSSAISSVVPSITNTVADAAKLLSGTDPFIIGPGIKTGFKIDINDPASLGTDIVANVAASMQEDNKPVIIFDAGTANTITVVNENRTVIGIVILPGLRISSESLSDNTELLDSVTIGHSEIPLIGKSTSESIRSGLVYGNSLMLDGYVRNIREMLTSGDPDNKPVMIATGDFAGCITSKCRNKFAIDDSLTLKGIAKLYYKNIRG